MEPMLAGNAPVKELPSKLIEVTSVNRPRFEGKEPDIPLFVRSIDATLFKFVHETPVQGKVQSPTACNDPPDPTHVHPRVTLLGALVADAKAHIAAESGSGGAVGDAVGEDVGMLH